MKSRLLGRENFKITDKKLVWFLIPVIFIVLAAVMMIVYAFNPSYRSAVNLGMDFAGGYTIDVKIGTNLTSDNYQYYCNQIDKIASELADANGETYGLKIDEYQKVGSEGSDSAIHVKYRVIRDNDGNKFSDARMEEVGEAFTKALNDAVLRIVPNIEKNENGIKVTYYDSYGETRPMDVYKNVIVSKLSGAGYAEGSYSYIYNDNQKIIGVVINDGTATVEDITELMAIDDEFSGNVFQAGTVNGAISNDLIYNAIIAVILALVIMLIYIAIRFELSSGLSAIIALAHDMLMMFSFMFIFHVEFSSTFIAALITILGYSINNTIIIFDRVRENKNIMSGASAGEIADRSVIETMVRSINTTLTTIFMIGMIAIVCAIAGITDMIIFTLPILVGLIAGLFSSIFIAPSVWALFNRNKVFDKSKKTKVRAKQKKEPETI